MPDEHMTDLGPCCLCEATGPTVRTVVTLAARSPTGHGWGCMACDLPMTGAQAVLCDACVARYPPGEESQLELDLRFACRGYPGTEGRIRFEDLRGEHVHRPNRHPDAVPQIPPLTVAATDRRFEQAHYAGRGCFCSRCGQTIFEGVVALRAWPEGGLDEYRYHPVCVGADPQSEDPYAEEGLADEPD